MTPRTIFTIILKLFGLSLFISLWETIPHLYAGIPIYGWDSESIIELVLITFITLAIYYFLIRLLLFKSTWVIDKLSLDKHFGQEIIDIKIDSMAVIQIAIIILGGLFFIDAIPLLVMQLIGDFQSMETGSLIKHVGFGYTAFYICKLALGYLLLTNSMRITIWVEQKNKNAGNPT